MPSPIHTLHIDYMRANVGEAPRFDPNVPESPQVEQWKEWSYLTRNLDSLESTLHAEKANRDIATLVQEDSHA